MSPSTGRNGGSGQPISVKIPPPPSDSASSGPYSASSVNSSSSAGSPKVAPAAYRRHSRKRSSQVLIPPIQAVRRRQSSGGQQVPQDSDWDGSGEDDADKSDSEGEYVDMFGRRRSVSVNAVASGATFLIGAQLFSKALTFILNQALLRFVGPGLFGASAQLEFFINTILYFSREAVRLATQRQSLTGVQDDVYRFEGGVVEGTYSGTIQQVVNIGFVAPMIGAPLAGALAYLYYSWGSVAEGGAASSSYFGTAIVLFSVSAIIELLSEPCFVLSQLQMEFRTRAAFESAAITVRCVLTFVFVLLANASGASIIAFALGQLAYSSILSGLYLYNALSSEDSRRRQYTVLTIQGVWPADGGNQKRVYFDPQTKQLAISIWLQTIFKHCLSEGDKFLVSLLLPITDQGVYAVVLNYGSLIARLVFLPVEDALRNYFSKALASGNDAKLSVTVLSTVLRIYTYVAILALTFGPACAPFLLRLVVSKEWTSTDAPGVLATYACYIPFLAYNGTLEALVQSVASADQIKRQGTVMVAFSLSFALAAYLLMGGIFHLGARGLIYASMLNMTMRIVWCTNWIEAYYRTHKELDSWQWLKQSIPSIWTLSITLIISLPVLYQGTVHSWPAFIKDILAALIMLATFAYSERSLILKGLNLSPSTSHEEEKRPSTSSASSSDSK